MKTTMPEYIDRDFFLSCKRNQYCMNCERRKNSKGKFVYAIGDAPCRACGIGDVLDDVEDFPAADVVEVVRCKNCRFFAPSAYSDDWCSAKSPGVSKGMYTPSGDSYCSDAERMTENV